MSCATVLNLSAAPSWSRAGSLAVTGGVVGVALAVLGTAQLLATATRSP